MKKILTLALMLVLLMPFALAAPNVYDQMRGRQMVPIPGAPWLGDNSPMYFGTGKDVSISYDSSEDEFYINDTNMYIEENLVVAGIFGCNGTVVDDGIIEDDVGITGNLDVGSTGQFGGALTGATVVSNATVSGTDLIASDDALITDDLVVDGAARIDETATVNALVSNSTGSFAGILSANGRLQLAENASMTIDTTLTSTSVKSVYGINAAGGNVTLTIPDSATVPGGVYFVTNSGNPGSNYARITATGGDDINGYNYLVSTDQYSNALIVAYGGAYYAITSGTWAQHA